MNAKALGKPSIVFISYRRADTDAVAGRLKDRMSGRLKGWSVFMDVTSIEPGADYKTVLNETLARTAVFIVLIGRHWRGTDGSRLDDTDDVMRYEIATALSLNKKIIPVLVNGASMPKPRDLPDELAALTDRNAIELRHARFDDDFANLLHAITGDMPHGSRVGHSSNLQTLKYLGVGALLGALLAIVLLVIHLSLTGKSLSERIGADGATFFIPLLSVLGALVAYKLRSFLGNKY